MVIAVTTRDSRSVAYLCSSSEEDTIPTPQGVPSVPAYHLRALALQVCQVPGCHLKQLPQRYARTSPSPVTFSVSAAVPAPQQ